MIWSEDSDITDWKHFYEATEGREKCAALPGPAGIGSYYYHSIGCFCAWAINGFPPVYCAYYGMHINPLYEGESGRDSWCIDKDGLDEIMSYQHPEWGLDCISGTPDDDSNNVG